MSCYSQYGIPKTIDTKTLFRKVVLGVQYDYQCTHQKVHRIILRKHLNIFIIHMHFQRNEMKYLIY